MNSFSFSSLLFAVFCDVVQSTIKFEMFVIACLNKFKICANSEAKTVLRTNIVYRRMTDKPQSAVVNARFISLSLFSSFSSSSFFSSSFFSSSFIEWFTWECYLHAEQMVKVFDHRVCFSFLFSFFIMFGICSENARYWMKYHRFQLQAVFIFGNFPQEISNFLKLLKSIVFGKSPNWINWIRSAFL